MPSNEPAHENGGRKASGDTAMSSRGLPHTNLARGWSMVIHCPSPGRRQISSAG